MPESKELKRPPIIAPDHQVNDWTVNSVVPDQLSLLYTLPESTYNTVAPAGFKWIRKAKQFVSGILDDIEQAATWTKVQEFNLRQALKGPKIQDYSRDMLFMSMLNGSISAEEAYDRGLMMATGFDIDWNYIIKDPKSAWKSALEGIAGMYLFASSGGKQFGFTKGTTSKLFKLSQDNFMARMLANGADEDVFEEPVIRGDPKEMPGFWSPSEEALWRKLFIGDQMYELLDRTPIIPPLGMTEKPTLNPKTWMPNATYANPFKLDMIEDEAMLEVDALARRTDISAMDVLRGVSFLFNAPDGAIDLATNMWQDKVILGMLRKGRSVLRLKNRHLASIDEIQEFINERALWNADEMGSEFPDFVKWRQDRIINQLESGVRYRGSRTKKVRDLEQKYHNALESSEPNAVLADIRREWQTAIDESRRMDLARGTPYQGLMDHLGVLINALKEDQALVNMLASVEDETDLIAGIVTHARRGLKRDQDIKNAVRETFERVELLKKKSPEQLLKLQHSLENLQSVRENYTAVRRRVESLHKNPATVNEIMEHVIADLMIGARYDEAGMARHVGFERAKSFQEILLFPDEYFNVKYLRQDPEVRDLIATSRAHEAPESIIGPISIYNQLMRDPYFASPFLKDIGLDFAQAEVKMMEWGDAIASRLKPVLEYMSPKNVDLLPGVGNQRREFRELAGRILSVETTSDPDLVLKYIKVADESVPKSELKEVMATANKAADAKIAAIDKELNGITNEIDSIIDQVYLGDWSKYASKSDKITLQELDRQLAQAYADNDMALVGRIRAERSGIIKDVISRRGDLDPQTVARLARIKALDAERDTKLLQRRKFERQRRTPYEALIQAGHSVSFDLDGLAMAEYGRVLSDNERQGLVTLRNTVNDLWHELLKADPDASIKMSGKPRNLMNLVNYLYSSQSFGIGRYVDPNNAYFAPIYGHGVPTNLSYDIAPALDAVLQGVNRRVHMKPIFDKFDLAITHSRDIDDAATTNLLQAIRDRVSGVPTTLDNHLDAGWLRAVQRIPDEELRKRVLEHQMLRPTAVALAATRGFYRGSLGFNPSFALKNLFGSFNTLAVNGNLATTRGMYRLLTEGGDAMRKAGLMRDVTDFFAIDGPASRLMDVVNKVNGLTENFNRGLAYWTAIDMALRDYVDAGLIKVASMDAAKAAGLEGQLIRQGLDAAYETQHIYNAFGKPTGWLKGDIWGSKALRPFIQFINFFFKQSDFAIRRAMEGDAAGFVRWLTLTGMSLRGMEAVGVDATSFAVASYGGPDIASPALDGIYNMTQWAYKIQDGDPEAGKYFKRWIDSVMTTVGGYVGLPMVQLKRMGRSVEQEKSNKYKYVSASGNYLYTMSDRERALNAIGVPSMEAKRLRDLVESNIYSRAEEAAVRGRIQHTLRKFFADGSLDDIERSVLVNMMEDMYRDLGTPLSKEAINSVIERGALPQGYRMLNEVHTLEERLRWLETNKLNILQIGGQAAYNALMQKTALDPRGAHGRAIKGIEERK